MEFGNGRHVVRMGTLKMTQGFVGKMRKKCVIARTNYRRTDGIKIDIK
jgi:hypothetical protein